MIFKPLKHKQLLFLKWLLRYHYAIMTKEEMMMVKISIKKEYYPMENRGTLNKFISIFGNLYKKDEK